MRNGDGNGGISRGNLIVILTAGGLVMAAFVGFLSYQNSQNEGRFKDGASSAAALQAQLSDLRVAVGRQGVMIQRAADAISAINERYVRNVVPREENETGWNREENDLKVLSERLNELRAQVGGTYTLRDEIAQLQSQMSELRRRLNERFEK